MDAIRKRFRGCLLGGAAGAMLGQAGANGDAGWMTLATAEGLLLGWDDSDELGSACLVQSVRQACLRRAGPAAGDALASAAPVGLFMWRPDGAFSIRPAFDLAAELAASADDQPGPRLGAGALAAMVAALADGISLPGALAIARHLLARYPDHEPVLVALNRAESYARAGIDPDQATRELGASAPGNALAIAAYGALVSGSFAAGLTLVARRHGGADAAAAVAGQLLGALYGVDAIPAHWLAQMEHRDPLTATADRLATYWRNS
ncbi:ADP-ribosylglycohydrolase family protein [Thioalkalivibrio sp. XN8]|uniref:ADP-ribosylglycohydrolase family protein n=1 Tax=Thioalkalivibrio sp. XN8 TaxID=2712863 RepID=UPI0013ECCFC4|nr:ADP-ribosylglycohydrolase family protein [Thioalkalivibrio sp. XN8]NGP52013.1 hypothetical protein [Thioalkalivibrio sp. XN8]